MTDIQHQSQLQPAENKFHVGNGADGKHYWLTPPALYAELDAELKRLETEAMEKHFRDYPHG